MKKFTEVLKVFRLFVLTGAVFLLLCGLSEGQCARAQDSLSATLSGDSEVPPVETDAEGEVTVVLDGNTLTLTGTFSGLASDYAASHIHVGAVGENGPPAIVLEPTVDADNRGGTFEAATNTFDLSTVLTGELTAEDLMQQLRSGGTYVNVHSADHPGGAIRGQLGVSDDL